MSSESLHSYYLTHIQVQVRLQGCSSLSIALQVQFPMVGQTQRNHCKHSCSKLGKIGGTQGLLFHSNSEIQLGRCWKFFDQILRPGSNSFWFLNRSFWIFPLDSRFHFLSHFSFLFFSYLRYNSLFYYILFAMFYYILFTIKYTFLKYAVQWFLVYSFTSLATITADSRTFSSP